MSAHIDMAVGFERDAFSLEEFALPFPSGSRTASYVDDAVARQHGSLRSIAKRSPHHAGVAGPTSQGGDEAVSHHAARGNLADDAEHVGLERPRLLCAHLVETVLCHAKLRMLFFYHELHELHELAAPLIMP